MAGEYKTVKIDAIIFLSKLLEICYLIWHDY